MQIGSGTHNAKGADPQESAISQESRPAFDRKIPHRLVCHTGQPQKPREFPGRHPLILVEHRAITCVHRSNGITNSERLLMLPRTHHRVGSCPAKQTIRLSNDRYDSGNTVLNAHGPISRSQNEKN